LHSPFLASKGFSEQLPSSGLILSLKGIEAYGDEGCLYLGSDNPNHKKASRGQKNLKGNQNGRLSPLDAEQWVEDLARMDPEKQKVLTSELMPRFKEPFGLLIPGAPEVAIPILKKLIAEEKASRIIAVGDVVSRSLKDAGINVDLYITDDRVMRERIKSLDLGGLEAVEVLRVSNPPGRLRAEAFHAIQNALRSPSPKRIMVEGEEDLLVLPAVILAPFGSLVLYGQPGRGLVAVRVTKEKKKEALELYRAMPEESSMGRRLSA
jgi:uncharacterized protein (UPF0218 family)